MAAVGGRSRTREMTTGGAGRRAGPSGPPGLGGSSAGSPPVGGSGCARRTAGPAVASGAARPAAGPASRSTTRRSDRHVPHVGHELASSAATWEQVGQTTATAAIVLPAPRPAPAVRGAAPVPHAQDSGRAVTPSVCGEAKTGPDPRRPAMWNSFSTDADLAVSARVITYPGGGGDEIHAYLARPEGNGPRPGIVAVHHMPGWDEFYREFCDRLARHGYQVICPDLYCRYGHGSPDDVAAKVRSQGGVHDDSVVADCEAALRWLGGRPDSNGKVGIIGSCSGGRHAVLTASRVPGFAAVVDLWGGGVVMPPDQLSDARPVAPIDHTAGLDAPLLGLFGNDDQHPTPEQVDIHEAALRKHRKSYEFHRYDGAGHGFFYYHSPMYRPEQAMDGWNRIFAFFGEHLAA